MIVPRVDRDYDRERIVGCDEWCGKGGKCRQSDRRLARSKRDAARGRNTDPQTGETPRPGSDCDTVNSREIKLHAVEYPRDQGHQRFGMSALHQQRFMSAQIRALGVQHGDRAGLERGIDG